MNPYPNINCRKDENAIDAGIELRSDLWLQMPVSDLCKQRDLVIDKINLVVDMAAISGQSPTIMMMHGSLQHALNDLNRLIDNRSTD